MANRCPNLSDSQSEHATIRESGVGRESSGVRVRVDGGAAAWGSWTCAEDITLLKKYQLQELVFDNNIGRVKQQYICSLCHDELQSEMLYEGYFSSVTPH